MRKKAKFSDRSARGHVLSARETAASFRNDDAINIARKPALIMYCILLFSLPVFILPATVPIYGPIFKGLIFKVSIISLIILWLFILLANQRSSDSRPIIRYNTLLLVLGSGTILLCASTAISIYPRQGVLGSYIDQEGLIVSALYVTAAFLFYQFKFRISEIRTMVDVIVASAAVVSMIAILQYFFGIGVLYAGFGSGLTEKLRPTSTLGNPVYMASYLVLIFPLALMQAFTKERSLIYYFRIAALFLVTLGILISFTRGSWLAMTAEAIMLLALIGYRPLKANSGALLNIAISLMLALIIFIPQLSVSSVEVKSLIGGGEAAITGGSIGTRLTMWDGAIKMIDHAPVTGFGPENIQFSYPFFGSSELYLAEGYGSVTRVHNDILQAALHGGILYLLVFLFLPIFALLLCIKAREQVRAESMYLFLGIGVAIIGYVLNNLSAFAVIAVAPIFWVLVGMLMTFASATGLSADRELKISPRIFQAFAALMTAACLIYLTLSVKQTTADYYDSRSIMSFKQSQPEQALELAKQAAITYSYESHYSSTLANTYYNLAPMPGYPDPLEALNDAREILEKIVEENPYNLSAVTNLGNIYYALGSMDDKKYYKDAETHYLNATKLNPIYDKNYAFLGNTYYFLGNKTKARENYEIAISLDPDSVEAVKGLTILDKEASSDL